MCEGFSSCYEPDWNMVMEMLNAKTKIWWRHTSVLYMIYKSYLEMQIKPKRNTHCNIIYNLLLVHVFIDMFVYIFYQNIVLLYLIDLLLISSTSAWLLCGWLFWFIITNLWITITQNTSQSDWYFICFQITITMILFGENVNVFFFDFGQISLNEKNIMPHHNHNNFD